MVKLNIFIIRNDPYVADLGVIVIFFIITFNGCMKNDFFK